MMPYPIVETRTGSIALLESTTALAAAGAGSAISSNFIETVDFLGARHSSTGLGGASVGSLYTYTPTEPAPYVLLDYYIYAEAAAGASCRGSLGVYGQVLTPTEPPTFLTERLIAGVTYAGDVLDYVTASAGYTRRNRPLTGTLRITARRFYVSFLNQASVAQAVFRLGVYLRGA